MNAPDNRTADLEVVSLETVREQLHARAIHIPGHATASLERTRQAIVQLSVTGMITDKELARVEKRFRKLVPRTVRIYKGNGAI